MSCNMIQSRSLSLYWCWKRRQSLCRGYRDPLVKPPSQWPIFMALESLSTQMTHITSYYLNAPPPRTIRICVCATFRDWTKWYLSVQSDHPTSKRGVYFIQKNHPLVWLKGPGARHQTSPPPQRDENCVTARESVFDRIQILASWTPLCMLHSFPFLESSILISCACLGAHLYFSSLIHNSNRNLKDELSCYFATIRWLPVVLFCVVAGEEWGSTVAVSFSPVKSRGGIWEVMMP